MAGTLTGHGINILSVDVYTRDDGFVLDTFKLSDSLDGEPVAADRWESIEKTNGRRWVTMGVDQVNAIYENSRWRLCDSDFFGTSTANGVPTLQRFKK